MALKQVLEAYELMDSPKVDGDQVKGIFLTQALSM